MKKPITSILLVLATLFVSAQVPEAFNYQAVVRNSSGVIVTNQNVSLKISILQSSETGPTIYAETHSATTNNFGLVNLQIGKGTVVSGVFMPGGWGVATHYIKVEIDPNGGSAFTHLGTSLLLSVPYAFHAQTVAEDKVNDADSDPGNEIQSLQLNGTQLSLSKGGGTVEIPSSADNWGTQSVTSDATLSGEGTIANPLKIANNAIQPRWENIQNLPGGFADNNDDVEDGDANPNNEIQTLSISGNELSISDGNMVTLPASPWESSGNDIYFNSGNVGIGTNNPLNKLDVYGSAGFHREGTGLLIGPSADMVQLTYKEINGVYVSSRFYWGKTEFMGKFIVKDGTIGIGNDSPLFPVDIYNPVDAIINLKAGKNSNIFLERGSSNDASVITFKNQGDAIERYIIGLNRNDAFSIATGNAQHGLFLYPTGDIKLTDNLFLQPNKKIGIGIDNPTYSLEIKNDDFCFQKIMVSSLGDGAFDGLMMGLNKNKEALFLNYEDGPMYFGNSGQRQMTINADGHVGIGTETPYGGLTLGGTGFELNFRDAESGGACAIAWRDNGNVLKSMLRYYGFDGSFKFKNYAAGGDIFIDAKDQIVFRSDGNTKMTLLNNGNLGIGTEEPERLLHLVGANPRILIDASSSNPEINFKNTGDLATSIWSIYKNGSTGDLQFYQNGNKLTLQKNTGNVGIGTITPQGKLDVNGTIFQRGGILHADYVFEENYQLESIEEHTEFMWENKHLPAIPKATVDENGFEIVEVGSHRKGIVEELEKAHIYISQLEKEIDGLKIENENLSSKVNNQETRLEKLESKINLNDSK
jgi:hypothetical protein